MARDAIAHLAFTGRAIRAARTRRPAFNGIGEIEQLFELALARRDCAGEGTANREIARVREAAPVVERHTPGRFAENHQAIARRAVARRRKLPPRRDGRALAASNGPAPPSAKRGIEIGAGLLGL